MAYKVLVVCALAAVALARPEGPAPGYDYNAPAPVHHAPVNAHPQYNFDYAVKDYNGNDFGHQESRDGYDTQGSYYVQLPDSRLQTVTYKVSGDSGFVADVQYQGEAQYPAYKPAASYDAPAPSYGPPAPTYGAPASGYA
ncbi:cuticle protein-like [Eriocheir sinensis]|uniref:cuticle protein-like n=1 Tax=Eriocheir sinensis TaxID=95602 RepID=UPI0021C9D36F|nr:cuticle protein-like [Eriocheir sinensis]